MAGDIFEIDTLDEGVWLFRPQAGSFTHTNSVVFERSDGLLVVESQPSPDAARDLLAAIAEQSDLPVRYLVLSHGHTESAGGASAFPEETLVIASRATQDALGDVNADLGGELRARAGDPADWNEPPRRLATLVVPSLIELADEKNPVEIAPIVRGHFPGQLLVRWNAGSSYYAGPLAFADRNPYADPVHSDLTGWLAALNTFSTNRPEKIVPQYGKTLDVGQLRKLRDGLAWIRGEVEFAFVEQTPPDEIVTLVLESEKFPRYFDASASPQLVRSVIERAVAESLEQRKKRSNF